MDCSSPGFSVCGSLQARILEWVAIPPGDLPIPGIQPVSPMSPELAGGFLITSQLCWGEQEDVQWERGDILKTSSYYPGSFGAPSSQSPKIHVSYTW